MSAPAVGGPFDGLTLKQAAAIAREAYLDAAGEGPLLWVYAIQADGYGGPIKLGISRDPVARLKTLQCSTAEELRGVAAWPAPIFGEREIHEMYACDRIRGEWFAHTLPMWRLITDLGGGFRWDGTMP